MNTNLPDTRTPHQPVLYQQVINILQPHSSGRYVDGTLGAGGHTAGILEASKPDGMVLGIDLDESALNVARERLAEFESRFLCRHGTYEDLSTHLGAIGWRCVDGIILDLGLSSMQLDTPERGFSFSKEAHLDMRFDASQETSAADLVNHLEAAELEKILRDYGEEPFSRRIAAAIVRQRPISSTTHLASVVVKAAGTRRKGIHPATRTFQALRIAVNRELEALEEGLREAKKNLCPGGRLAVISFQSLEDRRVKQFFQHESRGCLCPPGQPVCTCDHQASLRILTKKVIKPSKEEIERNPRARSAKLRVVEKM
jgi:16S rRNA (cytosine1402-N4)-methyltransferase